MPGCLCAAYLLLPARTHFVHTVCRQRQLCSWQLASPYQSLRRCSAIDTAFQRECICKVQHFLYVTVINAVDKSCNIMQKYPGGKYIPLQTRLRSASLAAVLSSFCPKPAELTKYRRLRKVCSRYIFPCPGSHVFSSIAPRCMFHFTDKGLLPFKPETVSGFPNSLHSENLQTAKSPCRFFRIILY